MASCELCGKKTAFGNKVTQVRTGLFSRTHKKIKPNLHTATLVIGGRKQRVTACARCIRTAHRANRIRQ